MIDQQLFLSALTEQEFRYWITNASLMTLSAGETLVTEDDFPDIYLVLHGQFVTRIGERSPGILGLDEFLTGWMTDREWISDSFMRVACLDSGRFGQMLSIETKRKHGFHRSLLPMLAGRLYLNLSSTVTIPIQLTQGLERGVSRFNYLKETLV